MNLPPGSHLAYIISREAWYAQSDPDKTPEIWVASRDDGGRGEDWGFAVREADFSPHNPAVGLRIFSDAFAAFADIPEFFAVIAGDGTSTLGEVRALLDTLGAADETRREMPVRPGDTRRQEVERAYDRLAVLRLMQSAHGDAGTVAYLLGIPVEDVLRVAPPGSPAARKQEDEDDVHAAHCCCRHGCKYGDAWCPVAQGTTTQDYPCEVCGEE